VDLILHDTYYVVGHFHYVIMGAIGFAVFSGLYYWYPLYTGRMYQRTLGKAHFWLTMVGTNVTFFAMILLGYGGMPRRYATYLPQFATLHQLATVGAVILLAGQIIFVWNFVASWLEGPEVTDGDPWDLRESGLYTGEWDWYERKIETAITDGGEEEEAVLPDGGTPDEE
jgi:cytochrome c oxidase subunit 1